jgi:hemerythrin-like domain-containing protein
MEDNPVTSLLEEHKIILKVVAACAAICQRLTAGEKVDAELLLRIVEFMKLFADKCHHGKEEDLLFPALEKAGVPSTGCPLEALRAEHTKGRLLVAQLSDSANEYAKSVADSSGGIINALNGIAKLYPNHIWKEDEMVFPIAERLFSPETNKKLLMEFEGVEAKLGRDVHSKLISFAEKLNDLILPLT